MSIRDHLQQEMKVLTYNLMFLSDYDRRERCGDILRKLVREKPDIMMFQEMNNTEFSVFKKYLCDEWIYKTSEYQPIESGIWSCIFVKKEISGTFGYIPFEKTNMQRGISIFKTPDTVYISTHLESGQIPTSKENRRDQLVQLSGIMEMFSRAIIGMDLNDRNRLTTPSGVVDVWADDLQPTWHGDRYYRDKDSIILLRLPYDRLLVKGFKVNSRRIDKFKKQSDHDALIIDVTPEN